MRIPTNKSDLTALALQLKEDCSVSLGQRQASYRQYGQWIETGRNAGALSLANLLYGHLDRLASHIYSPSELRFAIDFEREYDKVWHDRAAVVAKLISREWERKNIDLLFGHGVKEALGYGAYALKQLSGVKVETIGGEEKQTFDYRGARLVPPWRMGVYDESVNSLDDQECILETVYLNRHQVWRRVRSLENPEKLYKAILASSNNDSGNGQPTSFMHQVLSTAVLNTSLQNMTQPQPGGIVQLTNDPNFATVGPQVAPELYPMHELWIKDDIRDDWTTVQFIEPNILVAPTIKHCNLFTPHAHPYQLIQLNYVQDYIWGRSEIVDLMMLQDWMTTHLDDVKRLMGLQIDKILGIEGSGQITDEMYAQLTRTPGYVGVEAGSTIKDLTPQLDFNGAIAMIHEIISLMEKSSGFSPIMSGQGESGVRAGVHADTLMKTGSPRLRDRSLMAERQCAGAADATLSLFEAKDARAWWVDPKIAATDFTLGDLLDDRRVAVDSHSSSPIYHDDNAQLLAFGVKNGIIDGESFIEQMPFAHKDILIQRWKAKQAAEAELVKQYGLEALTGHKSRGRAA